MQDDEAYERALKMLLNRTTMENPVENNIKRIELAHHKNYVINHEGKLYRCICCDHEFAVYCPLIKKKTGEWRTRLSKPIVISNTLLTVFQYRPHHDDFWVMVDEEQRKADAE